MIPTCGDESPLLPSLPCGVLARHIGRGEVFLGGVSGEL